MGIPGFTKLFDSNKEVKLKDLKGKHIAIDAMAEIYRGALGMAKVSGLTDSNGFSTGHINTILLGVVLKLQSFGINQYWIFDNKYIQGSHNAPLKELELKKRSFKRKTAQKKAKEQQKKLDELLDNSPKPTKSDKSDLFSDSEEESEPDSVERLKKHNSDINECKKNIDKFEKRCFRIEEYHIKDIQFILDCLNIPWAVAPYRINNDHNDGYESEQFAAMLTNNTVFGIDVLMDYVLSPDADTLLFGAKKILKRRKDEKGTKYKFYEYDLNKILMDNDISHDELIKIGLILGTDFCPKTPKVGPKTVLKPLTATKLKNKKFLETLTELQLADKEKLRNIDIIELTPEQISAADKVFKKQLSQEERDSISWNNLQGTQFSNKEGVEKLIDWLVLVKSFNRKRIETQFEKNVTIE